MSTDIATLKRTLGQAIRRARVSSGMSQESFAERAGLHRTYIGSIERGERNVSLVNLSKVASALGLRVSELFALAEQEHTDDPQAARRAPRSHR